MTDKCSHLAIQVVFALRSIRAKITHPNPKRGGWEDAVTNTMVISALALGDLNENLY